jgi:sucrose-6-phosphatase
LRRLICTDLDRTLISNGPHSISPNAKQYFEQIVQKEKLTLSYVTGRHRNSIEQAIVEYHLPIPNYVVADVGTTIYQVDSNGWHRWESWSKHLSQVWAGIDRCELIESLIRIPEVSLQEPEKQSEFKLSFYVPMHLDPVSTSEDIESILKRFEVRSNLIWSVDEIARVRLLDVIPARANKLHAIRYLMRECNFSLPNTLFAGDSGNDIDVLDSDIPAVLVANASSEMKSWAGRLKIDSLYVAKGGLLEMNGNYCAGIVEGIIHYWPDVIRSLDLPHDKAQ